MDGYFTIVDRRKDMILVSGFNVYPNEVEAVLAGLAGVKDCAVIGVPDAASGEAVKAFIVRGDPALDAKTVRHFCRCELASYKCRDWSSSATICRSRTSARSCARICAKTRPRTVDLSSWAIQLDSPGGLTWFSA
jgi:acyl-coenzyme A synthetase/AMP-(fatty) acid ligase